MRKNEHGFTMIELLVVMAIAVILVVSIGFGWRRQENAASSATLTQQTLVMMRQARTRALESGGITRVRIDAAGTTLTLEQGTTLGLTIPTSWVEISQEQATQGGKVQAVAAGVSSAVGAGSLPGTIIFRPDGSATCFGPATCPAATDLLGTPVAAAIFVNDASGTNPNRVLVYSLTGFSRSVNGW